MRNVVLVLAVLCEASCLQPVAEGRVVGPEGGTVSANGAELVIPPGALATAESISIGRAEVVPPAGTVAVGAGVQLLPEGLHFQRPVQLTLPLQREAAQVAIATAPSGTADFQLLSAHREGLRATASVSHFSVFVPVAPASDAGAYGFVPGLEVEQCQPPGQAIHWWVAPSGVFETFGPVPGPTTVTETPTGYVFTSGRTLLSTDRALNTIESRDTNFEASGGFGLTGFCPSALDGGVVLSSAHSSLDYVEWQVGPDGHLVRGSDGGFMTRDAPVPGTYSGVGFAGPAPGCGAAPLHDAALIAADPHDPATAAIALVPRNPSLPAQRVRLPASFHDSSGGVELADGTVLFALHRYVPSFTETWSSIETQVHRLDGTNGLVPVAAPTTAIATLARGGVSGAVLVTIDRSAVSFTELDAGVPAVSVGLPDGGGAPWSDFDPVRTSPAGQVLVLLTPHRDRRQPGGPPVAHDVYLVRYPRGDLVPLATGIEADAPPTFAAAREGSIVVAFYNHVAGFHAARLCLPP